MQVSAKFITDSLQEVLDKRIDESLYRYLQIKEGLIDFCSNDFLSFARSEKIKQIVKEYLEEKTHLSGATGSRSISGNTAYTEELERMLAAFHQAEAALIFNSGYDANIGLFSCIAKKGDTIITDELIHASIIDGCRLSYADRYRFHHNDMYDLEKKLQQAKGTIFVAVESVYSMDGDQAPLNDVLLLCKKYNANLIVDEAHATGVFGKNGRGLVNHYNLEKDVFARIHTFGKALGCHGAVIVGPGILRNYLINFARSFIFTTALPFHSLAAIHTAYKELLSGSFNNDYLHQLISYFSKSWEKTGNAFLITSNSAVQSVIIPGNERVRNISKQLQEKGFDIRAIISPSVPVGKERLRISLHMHNTIDQVVQLQRILKEILVSQT